MFKELAKNSFQTGLPKAEYLDAERNRACLTVQQMQIGTFGIATLATTGSET